MSQERLSQIQNAIHPLRQQIINHAVYKNVVALPQLQIFMQHHVYAVWDFMSLLKTLQNNLTCTRVPWFPVGDADTRYLINEIVVGEECDVDPDGKRISHFELYLQAMEQCGADTREIKTFLRPLQRTQNLQQAFAEAGTPQAARRFVQFTFDVINDDKPHVQSAIFTFGREDLIPGMFLKMVDDLQKVFPENVSLFQYYLHRHIEVDGDHHSHLALQMTANLCGSNAAFWHEAETATLACLQHRHALWSGVAAAIGAPLVTA